MPTATRTDSGVLKVGELWNSYMRRRRQGINRCWTSISFYVLVRDVASVNESPIQLFTHLAPFSLFV